MNQLVSSSSIKAFIASYSGCDNGKILPFGGVAPGIRSMVQSTDRWVGSCNAFFLLKASARSAYSEGRFNSSVFRTDGEESWR